MTMDDLVGRTLGQYQIVQRLGEGGMATVYKAYQPSLNRYVAIKVLPPDMARQQPDFATRFAREAHAVAQLQHPHILSIYDFGQEDGLSYIVMQYVEAGTLQQRMHQPMNLEAIVKITEQLADALDYAHQRGVIHRDIKPTNVLMEDGRWPLLADFGIAKMLGGNTGLTAAGVGIGTPAYMSPEQGRGQPVDARSDVYSLGVMLFEMLTGRVPFVADTPMGIVMQHILDPLPPPRSLNPDIPEAVERVIFSALAKDPNDRFASAGEMATALKEAAATGIAPQIVPQATKITPAPPAVAVPKPRKRIQWSKILWKISREALGVAFFVALTACVVIWAIRNPETVQRIFEQVRPVVEGIVGRVSGESPTAEARAFADPILAAIADREPDYADDFSDPASGWAFAEPHGEGQYEAGKLVLDCSEGCGPQAGPIFSDFVLEIDVERAETATKPAHAVVTFRATEKFYGLAISPDGNFHLEQLEPGTGTAVTLIKGFSPAINQDDSTNHIQVIVRDSGIAFYINAEPVGLVHDDAPLPSGRVGVGLHGSGIAYFDNLKVWDISDLTLPGETPAPTRTPTPSEQARIFADPILAAIDEREPDYADDFGDQESGWPSGSTADGDGWGYRGGAYFILATYLPRGECCIDARTERLPWFSDFVLEVNAQVVSGKRGAWGVVFRDSPVTAEQPSNAHYGVRFHTDGAFSLWKNVGGAHTDLAAVDVPTASFEEGRTNRLTIIAQGPQIAVYLNGEPVWFVHDESSSRGTIALMVENMTPDTPLQERFDDLKVSDILGRIVYADDRTGDFEIYIANADGSGEWRLTDHPANDWEAAWSPDGTHIVFSSDRDAIAEDNYQLYIMNADGSNLTRLTQGERNDIHPSWSPDGSRIAFHSWCSLAVVNADGSGWALLLEGRDDLCVEHPTWSPDGHRIAFRSVTPAGDPDLYQHDIYVMNDDGAELLKLASFISESGNSYVVWSPDGSQVAFDISPPGEGQQKYYIVSSDGSGEPEEITQIQQFWYPTFWPQWSQSY